MEEQSVPSFISEDKTDFSSLASDEKIARGRQMAQRYADLDAEIKKLEDETIPGLKKEREDLAKKQIPDFFDNILKTDSIGLPEAGVDVIVKPFYHANIRADWPEEKREAAFDYLESIDADEVVAVTISCSFRRGEIEEAKELFQYLLDSKFSNRHPPKMEKGVPWNTLTALLREMVESGEAVDLEKIGGVVGRTAAVKKRKK